MPECTHELMRVLSASTPVYLVGPGELRVRDKAASICWCEACGTVLIEPSVGNDKTWLWPTAVRHA